MSIDTTDTSDDLRFSDAADLLVRGRSVELGGDIAKGLALYESVIGLASKREAASTQTIMALIRIASLRNRMGFADLAKEVIEVAVFSAAANGYALELAHGLVIQSTIEMASGDLEAGERLALAGRAQAESVGAERLVALADNNLGIITAHRGDASAALLRFASARAYGERAGDVLLNAMCENNIGRAYDALGMPEEAIPRFEEAVRIGQAGGPWSGVYSHISLAVHHAENGDLHKAEFHARTGLEAALALESPEGVAFAHVAAAAVAIAAGNLELADNSIQVAELLATQVAHPEFPGELATRRLALFVATHRPGNALNALEKAESCYAKYPDLWGQRRTSQLAVELRQLTRAQERDWLRDLDAHAPGARAHSRRVARLSLMLAGVIGVVEPELRTLEIAAPLHDLGSLSLPEYIVARSDVLTNLEREIARGHPVLGDSRLHQAGYPANVRAIVRHHHERWDGCGYPDRLASDSIPLGARIVAIAERYDSLRQPRGSREGLGEAAALKRLEAEAGTTLDPNLCRQFVRAVRRGYDELFESTDYRVESPHVFDDDSPEGSNEHHRDASGPLLTSLRDAVGSRYNIQRELRGGGMATVFLAHDPVLARDVVIKAVHASTLAATGVERFRREMAVAARLRHPNVLPVLDAHVDGRVLYFVTPFIEGGSLREHIDRAPLDLETAISILRDVGNALAAAHAEGVVHRDLKPENILLDPHPQCRAILADFGIARLLDSSPARSDKRNGASLTYTGVSIGTPGYMAPEQVFAQTDLDARVDVYAFGLIAFEMLAGRPPFIRETARETMVAHLIATPPRITEFRSNIPTGLANLIATSMEKTPADRFANGAALVAELAKL